MRNRLVASLVALILATPALQAEDLPQVDPASAGMRAGHLKNIKREVEAAHADGEFAGCVVAIGRGDRLVYRRAFGDRQVLPERLPMTVETVFDLASLTKPLATATSLMAMVEDGRLRLKDRIDKHLPEVPDDQRGEITLEQLLTHHSGHIPDNSIEDYRHGVEEAWRRLFVLKPTDPPGTRFRYSDVNFELLGKVVERVSGKPLDRFVQERVHGPLGMTETTFNPPAELTTRCAASEPRDGAMLVGEVHDPRAALLGGVAGHAGLFSTADDLAIYAAMMLGEGAARGVRVLSPATVREMTRPRQVSGARRAAGWDVLSPYSSNRGDLMSVSSFGHGGFTGTAMWIDPGHDLFVIFLSNRLHPDGKGSVNHLAGRIASIAVAAIQPEGDSP